MKTTKTIRNLLMAAAMLGLGMSVASCAVNEDNPAIDNQVSAITINEELLSQGINADMSSNIIEVEVKCKGEWSAVTPSSDSWLRIADWQVVYKGNQTLTLMIDENNTDKGRSSSLMLADSEGGTTKIDVYQDFIFYNNTSGEAFSSKGLGCGIDYDYVLNLKKNVERQKKGESFEIINTHKVNNIFNITQIEKLQKQTKDPLQASAYVEAVMPVAKIEAHLYDSCLVQDKTLEVGINMSISYGAISGRAGGSYKSKATEARDYINYSIVRSAPMYNVYLSPAELSAYASDPRHNKIDEAYDEAVWEQIEALIQRYQKRNQRKPASQLNYRGLTEEQETIVSNMEEQADELMYDYAGIFSANFTKRYNELYRALVMKKLAGKEPDYETADRVLNALDNEYGPFFIAGGTFGGSMSVYTEILKDSLNGESELSGEVQVEMEGLFSINGAIKYSEKGYSYLRNSKTQIDIYGGNANASVGTYMGIIIGEKPSNLNAWNEAMDSWIKSMWTTTDGTSTGTPQISEAAPISYSVTPIWMLFSYPEIQEYAQQYFMEKYKDRGIYGYFGIMKGEREGGQAEEASDLESDMWKN